MGEGKTFEELYLQERKKAQLLILTTVALAILLVGSILMGLNKQPTTPPVDGPGMGGGGPSGGGGMRFRGPGGGGGQGGIQIRSQ